MRTGRLLIVSQYALHGGVSTWGVSACGQCLPGGGGCLPRGVVCRGVSAWGGICPGGCWGICGEEVSASGPGWGVSQHAMGQTPPLWTDRHLWKHNLRKLRLQAAINLLSSKGQILPSLVISSLRFTATWFSNVSCKKITVTLYWACVQHFD